MLQYTKGKASKWCFFNLILCVNEDKQKVLTDVAALVHRSL